MAHRNWLDRSRRRRDRLGIILRIFLLFGLVILSLLVSMPSVRFVV
jgi:hypothetical protein